MRLVKISEYTASELLNYAPLKPMTWLNDSAKIIFDKRRTVLHKSFSQKIYFSNTQQLLFFAQFIASSMLGNLGRTLISKTVTTDPHYRSTDKITFISNLHCDFKIDQNIQYFW